MDLNKLIDDKCISRAMLARKVGIRDCTLIRYLNATPSGVVSFIKILLALGICPREYANSVTEKSLDCPNEKQKGHEPIGID